MAGYSGKPITAKLGVKPGMRLYVDGLPADVDVTWPAGVTVLRRLPALPLDLAWAFCVDRARLRRRLPALIAATASDGAVWISWPKKASGRATDLDENVVREAGLAHGVVDIKVAAVDDTWSALKFVRRVRDR